MSKEQDRPSCPTCQSLLTEVMHYDPRGERWGPWEVEQCMLCEEVMSMKDYWRLSPGRALRKPNYDEPGRSEDNVVTITADVAHHSRLIDLEWVEGHGLCGRFQDPRGRDKKHLRTYLQPINREELGLSGRKGGGAP